MSKTYYGDTQIFDSRTNATTINIRAATGKTLNIASNTYTASTAGTVSAPAYSFPSPSADTGLYASATDNIDFATAGVNRMNISAAGDVTISNKLYTNTIEPVSTAITIGASALTNTLTITGTTTSTGAINAPSFVLTGKGAYTQITSATTSVPVAASSGTITTVSLTTASASTTSFNISTSLITTSSLIQLNLDTYTGNGIPVLSVGTYAAGTASITISNYGSAALNSTVKFNYIIL